MADKKVARRLLWLFVHSGANPDVEIQLSPILRHDRLPSGRDSFYPVELAFYSNRSNACLFMWLTYMSERHRDIACDRLQSALKLRGQDNGLLAYVLSPQMRTLKHCAKLAVWRGLNRRLVGNTSQLPLPTSMKEYLLDYEC